MSNLLTSSRMRSRRDCARKHHLEYEQGWRPAVEPEYFATGRLFHVGMRAWWADGVDAALQAVAGKAKDLYVEALVSEMLVAYDAQWSGERAKYELVANEATFEAPLINPDSGASSRTFLLAGAVDKIVRDVGTGRLILVEHKTTSDAIENSADPYWAKLAMDAQVSQYFIGAEALGFPIESCLYDVVKKPAQRPLKATATEARKYTKEGNLYANQRETDETPAEYALRIRSAYAENPGRYFVRKDVVRLESQIRDHLYDAWATAAQIREDARLGRAPRNPDACHRLGVCPFWGVCANGLKPEEHPEMYVRLEDVHPELEVMEQRNGVARG